MTLPAPTPSSAGRRHDSLVPPGSFISIDFETANSSRASPIQIGVVRVLGGTIGLTHVRPVMPPFGHRSFSPGARRVHGLGPSYINGAAEWPEILGKLVRLATMDDGSLLPLVAHNASFERSVVNATSAAVGVEPPPFDYFCTVKYARQELPHLQRHKLNTLTEHLGLPEFGHHDAGEDARATALLLLRLARGV